MYFRLPVDDTLDLGLLEPRHSAALFALIDANRAHLRRYLPWVDTTRTSADSLAFIQFALEQYARGMSVNVGVFHRGVLAGVAGYHAISWSNRSTAVGYWLAEAQQGHGLMTRTVKALTTHAFRELGLHRLELRAAVDNKRSRGVAERAGYKLEGTSRQAEWLYDRFVDHAVYAALAGEWRG